MRQIERRSGGRVLLLAAAALASAACDSTTEVDCTIAQAAVVRLDPAAVTFTRLGDGVLVDVSAENACGREVLVFEEVEWSSSDASVVAARAVTGGATAEGYVSAISFGSATVSATLHGVTARMDVDVVKPETDAAGFTVLDLGEKEGYTTDLWVHGAYAYTGSGTSCGSDVPCSSVDAFVYVWSVQADGAIERVDSVALPGPRINDVKVSSDGSLLVATQEVDPAQNGIVLLDLADPAAPTIISHYRTDLENGVHNVWIERIDGTDYVFVVEDGLSTGGLHVLDVSDRAAPVEASHFRADASFVHDVYVRDGLAFVSHWDAGLVILDVGNGVGGGSPADPVEIGRLKMAGGNTHNAWYWPARKLVFVGEERYEGDEVGVMHVVDVSDLAAPTEVATFGIPGETPHNFWLDEAGAVLYAAWYTEGVRAIDVSGPLSGDLAAQGLEVGHVIPSGPRGAARVWAPQLHDGVVYLSDTGHGIWSVRFDGS